MYNNNFFSDNLTLPYDTHLVGLNAFFRINIDTNFRCLFEDKASIRSMTGEDTAFYPSITYLTCVRLGLQIKKYFFTTTICGSPEVYLHEHFRGLRIHF